MSEIIYNAEYQVLIKAGMNKETAVDIVVKEHKRQLDAWKYQLLSLKEAEPKKEEHIYECPRCGWVITKPGIIKGLVKCPRPTCDHRIMLYRGEKND